MFDNYSDILTVEDVCQALKIGKTNVYKMLKNGEIKSIKNGKIYLIPKLYLMDYIYKYKT